MPAAIPNSPDPVVLLLAPNGNDARNAADVLGKAEIGTQICATMTDLCHQVGEQTGALVITEETLDQSTLNCLLELLVRQPPWSDLPLVLLTTAGEIKPKTYNILKFLGPRSNVTLLERPLRAITLISVIKSALRSRNHQYEVRALLENYARVVEGAQMATAKFRAVFDQSSIFAGIMTLDGKIIEANRLCLDACGYRAGEVLGRPFWECGWWRGSPEVRQKLRAAAKSGAEGNLYTEVLPYVWADGTERIVEFALYPIRDEAGAVIFLHPTGVDITERRQAQARTEFLGQLTQKLSIVSDPREINRIATREIGEFLGAKRCCFLQAIPERDELKVLQDWRRNDQPGIEGNHAVSEFGPPEWWRAVQVGPIAIDDVRTHVWTRDFQSKYEAMDVSAYALAPFIHEARWGACIAVADDEPRHWTTEEQSLLENAVARVWPLIERARVEGSLRESEERFRAMGDNIATLAWMANEDGRIFWYNKRWYEFTGAAAGGTPDRGWENVQHPDHRARVLSKWRESVQGGHPWEDTFPMLGADGKYRWFLSRAFPIRDDGGRITLWFGTNTDVTELRETQDALRGANALLADRATHLEALVQQRTAKLRETVGEMEAFSYSIAHDMRAPLRSLLGFSGILLTEHAAQLDDEGKRFLHLISASADRMDKLIRDVLNYSRVVRGELTLEKVEVEPLLRGLVETYPMLAPDKAEITLEGPFPAVWGNEAMLTQIFSNLMGNAVKFVQPGMKPRVKLWAESRGPNACLFVQDDGIGIAPDQHEKIFEIFQQVDPAFEGTGIGLAIVKKAVGRLSGKVGLRSELDHGSTFWIEMRSA